MHELAIAKDLFDRMVQAARQNGLKEITKVNLRLGVLSGIDKDLLKHSLTEHLFINTMLEDTTLEIIEEKPQLKCKNCAKIFIAPEINGLSCPACGFKDFEIAKGKDVYIESIEGNKDTI